MNLKDIFLSEYEELDSNINKIKCKLCILVFGCVTVEKYKNETDGILQTWGKMCDLNNVPYHIFVGKNIDEYKDNKHIVSLEDKGVKDDYLSASYKHYIGMQWLLSRYDPDFMCIVGNDTWVSSDNMLKFLNNFLPENPVFIGNGIWTSNIYGHTFVMHPGGAGYVLSKKALEMIKPYLYKFQDNWVNIMRNHKQYLPACDVSLSLICYILQIPIIKESRMYENIRDATDFDNILTAHNMPKKECLDYYAYLNAKLIFIESLNLKQHVKHVFWK